MLALLQLGFRGRADTNDRDTAGKLGKPLLQLLAIVVRIGFLDFATNLIDSGLNVGLRAFAFDDGSIFLGHPYLSRLTEHRKIHIFELHAGLFGDDLTAGQNGNVLKHRLASVAEPGRLDGNGIEGATNLVDHERRQGLALDVLSDDKSGRLV